ncbi:MAG: hypothetical protein KF804_06235 [Burkholderiales bacterium]|nr:hypothetical protein [Burkholderiales bacterium]
MAFSHLGGSSGVDNAKAQLFFSRVLEKLDRKFLGKLENDLLTAAVIKDGHYADAVPFAYALTLLRISTKNPEFLISDEKRKLFEFALSKMIHSKLSANRAVKNAMPILPGLSVNVGLSAKDIVGKCGLSLNASAELVSNAGVLIDLESAEENLVTWLSRQKKIPVTEARSCLFS